MQATKEIVIYLMPEAPKQIVVCLMPEAPKHLLPKHLFSGIQDDSLRLDICESVYHGAYIYSSGRHMYVNFTSDDSLKRRGFELQYTAIHTSMEKVNKLPILGE